MSFKNTALATFASLAAPVLALGATHNQDQDLSRLEIKQAKSSATQALGKTLNDEFTGAPRDTGIQLAQFGFGQQMYYNNRRYAGGAGNTFNLPFGGASSGVNPYSFNRFGSRFGGATNGLGGNRYLRSQPYNQQNQTAINRQAYQANQNQLQSQAVKNQQSVVPNLQLTFQEKLLAKQYADKLDFADASVSNETKQEIADVLARTHTQFYKLTSDQQTTDQYAKLLNANLIALNYLDGASAKVLPSYANLRNKIHQGNSIPEPKLEPKPILDLPGTYNAKTNSESAALASKFSKELDSIKFKTTLSPDVKARMSNALASTYEKYSSIETNLKDDEKEAKYHELVTVALKEQGFKKAFPESLLKNLFQLHTKIAEEREIPETL